MWLWVPLCQHPGMECHSGEGAPVGQQWMGAHLSLVCDRDWSLLVSGGRVCSQDCVTCIPAGEKEVTGQHPLPSCCCWAAYLARGPRGKNNNLQAKKLGAAGSVFITGKKKALFPLCAAAVYHTHKGMEKMFHLLGTAGNPHSV